MRTPRRHVALFGFLATLLLLLLPFPARAAYEPDIETLQPGQFVTLSPAIPVNIVFVGFKKAQVNEPAIRAMLPVSYDPAVRAPRYYGLEGRDLGLNYTFEYDFEYTDDDFEDDFFGYLRDIGEAGDPTVFQQFYNEQAGTLDVDDSVLYIDAPSAEKWLADHAPDDVDVEERAYTVYFINWYGRDDFAFHLYTKTDDPDPDTLHNFGNDDPHKTVAWGGTTSRAWFYDFSAGPDYWGGSFDITNPDLDGDEVPDYRIPTIWEYAIDGYRDPALLGDDIGRLTRYVAINLLFTTSPLYDPFNTTPGRDGRKVLSVNMLKQDANADGRDFIDMRYVRDRLRSVQPYYNWTTDLNETDPIDPEAQRALEVFANAVEPTPEDCSTAFSDTFAELYCYFDANRSDYFPAYEEDDYVIPVAAFNLDEEGDPLSSGLLGFADDNWRDGTQSYIFEFDSPQIRELGFGFSVTTIHEVGHHIGFSHPHDGLDSTTGLDYGPGGDFFYAWVGGESHSVMHYLSTTNVFGQFDRDNMYRWETAGYINRSNELLAAILASPDAESVDSKIESADRYAQRSLKAFKLWNYLDAARHAYRSYNYLREAAEQIGVTIPQAQRNSLLPIRSDVPKNVDPINPRNR